MNTSQTLLQQAILRSDQDAWNRLADIYRPLLIRWLRRYGLQPHDVDDLVQEVLLYMAEELPKFEHNGRAGAFRCWLRQILIHRLRKFWNSRDTHPAATGRSNVLEELQQLEDPASGLSRIWEQEYEQQVLLQLLEYLRPRFEERTWRAFHMLVFEQKKTC